MSVVAGCGIDILAAVVRADVTGEQFAFSQLEGDQLDAVVACAERHGIAGLVYHVAEKRKLCSHEQLARLREAAYSHALRSWSMSAELIGIVDLFRRESIDFICLKGTALALRAYGRVSARTSADIDLLIHEADLQRASVVLEQRGYCVENEVHGVEGEYHNIFSRSADKTFVELHWSLLSSRQRVSVDAFGLWSDVEHVRFGEHLLPALSIEDTLLFLSVHGFKHEWNRLKWIIDVAYLSGDAALDWDVLFGRARQARCLRLLLVALQLADELFGSGLPAHIKRRIESDTQAVAIARSFRASALSGAPVNDMELMVHSYQIREHWTDRLQRMGEMLSRMFRLTPKDGVSEEQSFTARVRLFLRRPVRIYREYGLAWAKPLFRFRSPRVTAPLP